MTKPANKVTPPDSSYHDLSSSLNNLHYRIFVGGIRPDLRNTKPRPIVFVLDGNWLFASVYEYLRTLSIFDPSIGDPIVIGVGYPTEETPTLLQLRERDLAPLTTNMKNVDDFLSFINHDIVTFLSSEFGIRSNKKILTGHSWGASFTLYTLIAGQSDFTGYLASSPLIIGTMMENIDQYIKNLHLANATKLFSSVGTDEATMFPQIVEGFPHLEKALEQFAPENLAYRQFIFEDENHSSITLAALTKGLRYLLV